MDSCLDTDIDPKFTWNLLINPRYYILTLSLRLFSVLSLCKPSTRYENKNRSPLIYRVTQWISSLYFSCVFSRDNSSLLSKKWKGCFGILEILLDAFSATLCFTDLFFLIYINRMLFSKNPTTTPQLFWYLLTIQLTEETLIHYITPYQPGLRLVISGICAEVVLLQS